MNSDKIVALLRKAYTAEIETVMNYQVNSIVLDGVRAEEIKDSLRSDIQEELDHAEQIGRRLKQIGERAPASGEFKAQQVSLQPPEDSTDVCSVIQGVLNAEQTAIESYRELIAAATEADDPVTEDLAVRLLADEEAHRTEFRGFKKEYVQLDEWEEPPERTELEFGVNEEVA
jgi:bacterioferritin